MVNLQLPGASSALDVRPKLCAAFVRNELPAPALERRAARSNFASARMSVKLRS